MDSKHILIIPSWYPATSNDVGGSFFREQAIALKKRGYKVGVIFPAFRSMRDVKGVFFKSYGISYEVDNGVNTYRYHSINLPRMPELANKRWLSAGWKLYKKYIRKHGVPDIIHVHSIINAGFLAFKLYEKHKVPYMLTEHSTAFARGLVEPYLVQESKKIVENSKYNIAVSNEFKLLLSNVFEVNSWNYVPNIVSEDFFSTSSELISFRSGFTFINICLLDKKKKVVVAKSFKNDKNIVLKIGGDGPERGYLEKLTQDLGVKSQVHFLGMLSREQVKEQVAAADAFVLSSEYETFGVVVIEALALGKPVIATKSGGPESILNDEVGYLVDVNDVEQMSEAMIDLYKNIDRFDAEYIRSYCRNNFSEDAVISKLSSIYQSVVESN